MLEACNTSFQVHFQIDPEQFARYYNIAQAIAAPVLAVAVNSPLLFGKRLWQENRIGVFQQIMDTRHPVHHQRGSAPRVSFGNGWVRESVLEIFQEDIARFRVLMGTEIDENPFEALEQGRAPKLKALQIHNGTVYRWNRPCYGITEGKPHLRIEKRILPAGPTPLDEIANAAFWLGLINGMAEQYQDITNELEFDDIKSNFIAAARHGLKAHFSWLGNKTVPAQERIRQLLPLAREGLQQRGIDANDIERYLEVIEARITGGQTGASWLLNSFAKMQHQATASECLSAITATALENQKEGKAIHEWPLAQAAPAKSDWRQHYRFIEQYMTKDVFTVLEDDTLDLVLSVMHWRRIRHIPVEDSDNFLVGLIDYRSLILIIAA